MSVVNAHGRFLHSKHLPIHYIANHSDILAHATASLWLTAGLDARARP